MEEVIKIPLDPPLEKWEVNKSVSQKFCSNSSAFMIVIQSVAKEGSCFILINATSGFGIETHCDASLRLYPANPVHPVQKHLS